MSRFIQIAFRNLVKNKTRTLILSMSIIVTTVILVVLMAMTSGIQETMLKTSTTLLTGHINVAGFYKISSSSASPVVTSYQELEQIVKNNVTGLNSMVDRVKGWGKVISDTSSVQTPIWGIDIRTETEMKKILETVQGEFGELEQNGNIAIFETHAKRIGVVVGDMVTVSMPTYRNINNTKDLKVCAVLKDVGFLSNFSVFMTKDDLREIYQMNTNSTGQIMLYLDSVKRVPEVENTLRKAISEKGFILMDKESQPFWMKFNRVSSETWTGQKIDITTWEDEISFMSWIIKTLNILSVSLVLILLFIVVLGITNSIWMSIKERTNEVGTLRAIGMQKNKIVLMFLIEGAVLSSISAFIGICLGVMISYLVNWIHIPVYSIAFKALLLSDYIILNVRFSDLLFSFVVITFFTTCGALIPAYRAGKMKPITAINFIN